MSYRVKTASDYNSLETFKLQKDYTKKFWFSFSFENYYT
jgi:hypothetical protein